MSAARAVPPAGCSLRRTAILSPPSELAPNPEYPMTLRRIAFALLALAPLALLGCKATSYQDAPIPTGPPQEGMCRVYVMRTPQVVGTARRIEVIDRDHKIGDIGADGYLCWDRVPGKNPIQVIYHGAAIDTGNVEGLIHFDGKAGGVYFYTVHLRGSARI